MKQRLASYQKPITKFVSKSTILSNFKPSVLLFFAFLKSLHNNLHEKQKKLCKHIRNLKYYWQFVLLHVGRRLQPELEFQTLKINLLAFHQFFIKRERDKRLSIFISKTIFCKYQLQTILYFVHCAFRGLIVFIQN